MLQLFRLEAHLAAAPEHRADHREPEKVFCETVWARFSSFRDSPRYLGAELRQDMIELTQDGVGA
jgi:hypothetical protein